MIDIHCHILPSLDDGPKQLQDCLEMAAAAVRGGITHIYATPHHLNGIYENTKVKVLEQVTAVNLLLQQKNIPVVVLPGQELRIHLEIYKSLKNDEILTLGNTGKYLLLELPSAEVPRYTKEIVYELLLKGITPIIAHPERNRGFLEEPNLLVGLVREGAMTQITSGSIKGQFGKRIKLFSEKIVEHHLAHFIASDAHNLSSRGFSLQGAYETITSKFGIDRTFLFKENAVLMMEGQSIYIEEPISIRKRILGIF